MLDRETLRRLYNRCAPEPLAFGDDRYLPLDEPPWEARGPSFRRDLVRAIEFGAAPNVQLVTSAPGAGLTTELNWTEGDLEEAGHRVVRVDWDPTWARGPDAFLTDLLVATTIACESQLDVPWHYQALRERAVELGVSPPSLEAGRPPSDVERRHLSGRELTEVAYSALASSVEHVGSAGSIVAIIDGLGRADRVDRQELRHAVSDLHFRPLPVHVVCAVPLEFLLDPLPSGQVAVLTAPHPSDIWLAPDPLFELVRRRLSEPEFDALVDKDPSGALMRLATASGGNLRLLCTLLQRLVAYGGGATEHAVTRIISMATDSWRLTLTRDGREILNELKLTGHLPHGGAHPEVLRLIQTGAIQPVRGYDSALSWRAHPALD